MPSVRPTLLGAALGAAVLAGAPSAAASAPATDPATAPAPDVRIKPGITAGGIDVGGLTVDEAAAKLEQLLGTKARRDVVLKVGGRTFRLDAATAQLEFDAVTSAKRALYAKAPDAPAGGGTAAKVDVPLKLTFSTLAIRAWAREVSGKVSRAPRDATLKIGLRKIDVRASKKGRKLDAAGTERIVKEVLGAPLSTSRVLSQRVSAVKPAVTYKTLRNRNRTIITVSKSEFRLRLFKDFRVVKTYGVATGLPGYATPSGLFRIQNKQINPVWSVPNSAWAGELAGTTVAGGTAQNPLKARWMGVSGAVGIHGTGAEYSIGSRASRGCVRMRVADVIALYRRVPVGTPVLIR